MAPDDPPPWWRGSRGEWYVPAQLVLVGLVFFGPRTQPGLPAWSDSLVRISTVTGAALALAGGSLLIAAILRLGPGLSPLARSGGRATLVRTGPYGLVRHPMNAGLIALAFGWALLVRGWLTLLYAALLLVVLEMKSGLEERRLAERFPEYAEYRRRVRKLIPFVH